jgi:D-beta-D-heptose 7-phosphate kinase/D-beta-D-heptose 1-phosphate adenosyltransferase
MIKILVIGETCTDRFIYCEASRFSPEAPVPVLTPIEIKTNAGMCGNVVANLKSLSDDLEITMFHQEEYIYKTRYVEKKSNHMFMRFDEGESCIIGLAMSEAKKEMIKKFDIVIVSDYDKGFISNDVLKQIGSSAKLSILDSKRKLTKEITSSYTFVKLNENEANSNQDLMGSENLIVTLGSRGCMYMGKTYSSPKPQETIDVSGAGDTFTASFILKYFETKDVEKSIIYANEMSSIVVSKRGVATPK